jgi:hypothetical protein
MRSFLGAALLLGAITASSVHCSSDGLVHDGLPDPNHPERATLAPTVHNRCVPGDCRVDADCGSGGYCSPSLGACGAFEGYYCHSSADACVDERIDCPGSPARCQYDPAVGHFVCGNGACSG